MARALLFTGEPRIGKSTAVRSVIQTIGQESFVGFTTIEDLLDGQRQGFGIATIDGREGTLASIHSSSSIRVGGTSGRHSYGIDLSFLEEVALPSIRKALESQSNPRIIIVDEIGPMQLYSNQFKDLVLDVMADKGATLFGSVVLRSVPWVDELKARVDVETFLLTRQNRNTLTCMMTFYLSERLRQR